MRGSKGSRTLHIQMNTEQPIPPGSFLTSAQLAQFLGVTDRWVRKIAINRGLGVKFGHTWMFTRSELNQLLEERKAQPDWHKKTSPLANEA